MHLNEFLSTNNPFQEVTIKPRGTAGALVLLEAASCDSPVRSAVL